MILGGVLAYQLMVHVTLLQIIMRRRFDQNGKFYDVHGEYPDLTRAVAA